VQKQQSERVAIAVTGNLKHRRFFELGDKFLSFVSSKESIGSFFRAKDAFENLRESGSRKKNEWERKDSMAGGRSERVHHSLATKEVVEETFTGHSPPLPSDRS